MLCLIIIAIEVGIVDDQAVPGQRVNVWSWDLVGPVEPNIVPALMMMVRMVIMMVRMAVAVMMMTVVLMMGLM